jgi:hypothetical protein
LNCISQDSHCTVEEMHETSKSTESSFNNLKRVAESQASARIRLQLSPYRM